MYYHSPLDKAKERGGGEVAEAHFVGYVFRRHSGFVYSTGHARVKKLGKDWDQIFHYAVSKDWNLERNEATWLDGHP